MRRVEGAGAGEAAELRWGMTREGQQSLSSMHFPAFPHRQQRHTGRVLRLRLTVEHIPLPFHLTTATTTYQPALHLPWRCSGCVLVLLLVCPAASHSGHGVRLQLSRAALLNSSSAAPPLAVSDGCPPPLHERPRRPPSPFPRPSPPLPSSVPCSPSCPSSPLTPRLSLSLLPSRRPFPCSSVSSVTCTAPIRSSRALPPSTSPQWAATSRWRWGM